MFWYSFALCRICTLWSSSTSKDGKPPYNLYNPQKSHRFHYTICSRYQDSGFIEKYQIKLQCTAYLLVRDLKNLHLMTTMLHKKITYDVRTKITHTLLIFLRGLVHLPFLKLYIINFEDIKIRLKLASQQYRAWSDCANVQSGLALFWWQMLITLGSSKTTLSLL